MECLVRVFAGRRLAPLAGGGEADSQHPMRAGCVHMADCGVKGFTSEKLDASAKPYTRRNIN